MRCGRQKNQVGSNNFGAGVYGLESSVRSQCRGGRRMKLENEKKQIEGHAQRAGIWIFTCQSNSVDDEEVCKAQL